MVLACVMNIHCWLSMLLHIIKIPFLKWSIPLYYNHTEFNLISIAMKSTTQVILKWYHVKGNEYTIFLPYGFLKISSSIAWFLKMRLFPSKERFQEKVSGKPQEFCGCNCRANDHTCSVLHHWWGCLLWNPTQTY